MELRTFSPCRLCPRDCGAKRSEGHRGRCGVTDTLRVARAALHYWEEPCISGENGSGAVFFSGCNLGCVFCQNRDISDGRAGKDISPERLLEIFFSLKKQGAANINLVTPSHYLPALAPVLQEARASGLDLPIVYNTGGYEYPEALRLLDGLVDIYLPDFKYMDPALAARYSQAPDYPDRAKEALAEMVRQTGEAVFDEAGMMKRGVIVRHLALPGQLSDSMSVLAYLHETYGEQIFLSIMNQYTPMPGIGKMFPELGRKLSEEEYDTLVDYAVLLGVENGFIQEGDTAEESFIPPFDLEGV